MLAEEELLLSQDYVSMNHPYSLSQLFKYCLRKVGCHLCKDHNYEQLSGEMFITLLVVVFKKMSATKCNTTEVSRNRLQKGCKTIITGITLKYNKVFTLTQRILPIKNEYTVCLHLISFLLQKCNHFRS